MRCSTKTKSKDNNFDSKVKCDKIMIEIPSHEL